MPKVRVSTTVDADLLARARRAHGEATNASLLEAAFESLLDAHRQAEVDAAYDRAYSATPVTAPDAWGDLDAWRRKASS